MDPRTEPIIAAAIEVHRLVGPGHLESFYEECFCHELALRKIAFEHQVYLPVRYKDLLTDYKFRADVIVDNYALIELKAVEKILPVHKAQTLTNLKLSGLPVALLINFDVPILKDGLRRFEARDVFPQEDLL